MRVAIVLFCSVSPYQLIADDRLFGTTSQESPDKTMPINRNYYCYINICIYEHSLMGILIKEINPDSADRLLWMSTYTADRDL